MTRLEELTTLFRETTSGNEKSLVFELVRLLLAETERLRSKLADTRGFLRYCDNPFYAGEFNEPAPPVAKAACNESGGEA